MKKVLVVNCHRNGLSLIRSLGEERIYVIAVSHSKKAPGLYSKYVKEKHIIPDRITAEKEFIAALIAIAKKHKEKIHLIPTSDEYVELFIEYKNELKPHFHLVQLDDSQLLYNCVDKTGVHATLSNSTIDLPKHFFEDDLNNNRVGYPVIIKPSNKQNRSTLNSDKLFRIRICENAEQLQASVDQLKEIGLNFVIQEIIEGKDDELYTCGIVAKEGKLKACFTGRKLRQFPPMTGEASYAESIDKPELIELAKTIAEKTNFTGISQIEFKHSNGTFYFIEMNPRSWSWNRLATHCGVNLAKIAIDDHQSDTIITNSKYGTWSFGYEDLLHNVFANRNVNFFKCIWQIFRANKHAYCDRKDLYPFVRYYIFDGFNLFKHFIKTVFRKKAT